VYSVEVAPEGRTNWVIPGRKRGGPTDLWGVCRTSELGIALIALRWNHESSDFQIDREVLTAYMVALKQAGSEVPSEARRAIRAYVCQCLAGSMAEMISENETHVTVEPREHCPHDDATIARACCRMLPSRNEWDHLNRITEIVLREHWGFVVKLADALQATELLKEGIGDYLPPPIKNWPPSPRSKRKDRATDLQPS